MKSLTTFFTKHAPTILFFLIILIQVPIIFSHKNFVFSWFNIDDGFYYFVIARNIASGLGVTFDGVTPTNGFHPLWMVLLTPIFTIPDKVLPLRILAGGLILLNAGTGVLSYRLVSRRLAVGTAFVTGLAFVLLPPIHHYTTRGGMEVGLSAFLTVLALNRLADMKTPTTRSMLTLGLIAGLAILARLDHMFLAASIGLAVLIKTWNPPANFKGGRLKWLLRQGMLFFIPAFGLLLVYMIWSQVGFGTFSPVSGQVKRYWGTLSNSVYGFPPQNWRNYIGQFVTNNPSIGPWALLTKPLYEAAEFAMQGGIEARRLVLAGMAGVGALLIGLLFAFNRKKMLKDIFVLGLLPLFFGCLFQIAYYKVSGSVAQRPWYWINEGLFLVLAGGVLLDTIGHGFAKSRLPQSVRTYLPALTLAVLVLLLVNPHVSRLQKIFTAGTDLEPSFYENRASWLEENTEPDALIGMTGSGSSAYFTNDRRFYNLDGLVNSYEYLQALKAGTAIELIEAAGVDYVFGNEYMILESDPYGDIFAGHLKLEKRVILGTQHLLLWRFSNP